MFRWREGMWQSSKQELGYQRLERGREQLLGAETETGRGMKTALLLSSGSLTFCYNAIAFCIMDGQCWARCLGLEREF